MTNKTVSKTGPPILVVRETHSKPSDFSESEDSVLSVKRPGTDSRHCQLSIGETPMRTSSNHQQRELKPPIFQGAFWMLPKLSATFLRKPSDVSPKLIEMLPHTRGQPCFPLSPGNLRMPLESAHLGKFSLSRGGGLTWSSLHKQCSLRSPWWCAQRQMLGTQYHKAPGSVSVSGL